MASRFRPSGIPGIRGFSIPHKPKLPYVVAVLGWGNILSSEPNHVAITGVAAGAGASLSSTPGEAHVGDQSDGGQHQHLSMSPHPTGAFVQSHPFVVNGALIVHLYHYFEDEWPVEDDFNFFELHQGGNLIFALRVTNEGGGVAGLHVVDADGGLSQVGGADVIQKDTRHFIQLLFDNNHESDLIVDVDHTTQLHVGDLPDPLSTTPLNLRDPSGGPITAYIKNATTGPTLETTTHCAGLVVRSGEEVRPFAFFTNEDLLIYGTRISANIANAEFDVFGASPGPDITGTSRDASDWDDLTDISFLPNQGGLWITPRNTAINENVIRWATAYSWIYTIDTFAPLGPADLRLHYGGTRESPSNADVDFIEAPFGATTLAHAQKLLTANVNPLPAWDQDSIIGFEAIGTEGQSQVVRMVEAHVSSVYEWPLPPSGPSGIPAGGGVPTEAMVRLNSDGTVAVKYRQLSIANGRVMIRGDFGQACAECCDTYIIRRKQVRCDCHPTLPYADFDLRPYQGDGVGFPCSFWRVEMALRSTIATWYSGKVNSQGRLLDLPDNTGCFDCENLFTALIICCIRDPDLWNEFPFHTHCIDWFG